MAKKKIEAPALPTYKLVQGDQTKLERSLNDAAALGYHIVSTVLVNPSLIYVFMEHNDFRGQSNCCLQDFDEVADKLDLANPEKEETAKRTPVDLTPDK